MSPTIMLIISGVLFVAGYTLVIVNFFNAYNSAYNGTYNMKRVVIRHIILCTLTMISFLALVGSFIFLLVG